MSRSSFLIGADPELFLQRLDDKRIVSAIGKIGGTKEAPKPVPELGPGFAIQEDNVLVEFNIPPARDQDEFYHYNNKMLQYLTKKVREEHNCKLAIKASNIMDDSELEDPMAHVFGCEPDFNVWTMEDNPRPTAVNPKLRSAGGHIHIGLKMGRMEKIALARLLDSTLGLWSVTVDKDTRRRELYGKAGSIRDKKYGLEYRTLSNFWLATEDLQRQVYNQVELAITQWRLRDFHMIEKYGPLIFQAINNSDVPAARKMLEGA